MNYNINNTAIRNHPKNACKRFLDRVKDCKFIITTDNDSYNVIMNFIQQFSGRTRYDFLRNRMSIGSIAKNRFNIKSSTGKSFPSRKEISDHFNIPSSTSSRSDRDAIFETDYHLLMKMLESGQINELLGITGEAPVQNIERDDNSDDGEELDIEELMNETRYYAQAGFDSFNLVLKTLKEQEKNLEEKIRKDFEKRVKEETEKRTREFIQKSTAFITSLK